MINILVVIEIVFVHRKKAEAKIFLKNCVDSVMIRIVKPQYHNVSGFKIMITSRQVMYLLLLDSLSSVYVKELLVAL